MLLLACCLSLRTLRRAASALFALLLVALPALAQKTIHVPADQPTIQAGINASSNGDTVLVAPGTYTESLDFKGRLTTVKSDSGAAATILQSASPTDAAVTFRTKETRASVLQGFTITNANGSGAIAIRNASPTVSQNVLLNNACVALVSFDGSPLIQNNRITGTATSPVCGTGDTWGINLQWNDQMLPSRAEIVGNTIAQNTFDGPTGSAIYVADSRVDVVGNRILRNTATSYGAALIGVFEDSLFTANNVIAGNASTTGAAVYLSSAFNGRITNAFVNNTVVDNLQTSATTNASQVIIQGRASGAYNGLLLANNLVAASTANPLMDCGQTYYSTAGPYGNSAQLSNNILSNSGTGGAFNSVCRSAAHDVRDTTIAPAFVDRANGDYHLAPGSEGIDSGSNSVVQVAMDVFGYALDQDGEGFSRVSSLGGGLGSRIDIGAFEFSHASNHPGLTLLLTTDQTPLADAQPAGQPLTLYIQARSETGVATGLVSVSDLQGAMYPPATLDSNGRASITTGLLAAGVHTFVASCFVCYPTDEASMPLTILVAPGSATTRLTVASSQNPAQRGTPVRLLITLQSSAATPTGTLTVSEGATLLGNAAIAGGVATFDLPATLLRGLHSITIAYPGDGTAPAASTTFAQTITGSPSSTSLTVSAMTVQSGTSITLTSAVSSVGTASADLTKVQILDGSKPLAPLTVAGTVTTTVTLAPGTHTLTAVFAGDSNLEPSTSAPVTVTVQGAPSTLVLSTAPTQPLAFQSFNTRVAVTASGTTPRGTVALTVDGKAAASFATVDAAAAGTALNLPAGSYALAATFSPTDSNSLASTATASLIVSRAPVSLTLGTPVPAPFPQSQPPTLTAMLDDGTGRHLATGSIGLVVDGAAFAPFALPQDGHVSAQLAGLSIGTHTVVFSYTGDANFLPATTASVQITVLDRDFTMQHDTDLTVPAGTYIVRTLSLRSIGDFSGPVTLSCQALPPGASCRFAQTSPSLSTSGTVTVQFAVETSALPGYRQSALLPSLRRHAGLVVATLLLPCGLLFGTRRRSLPALLALCLVSLTLSTAILGCSGQMPAYTAPGTYTVQIVGQSSTIRHAHSITLHVTAPPS